MGSKSKRFGVRTNQFRPRVSREMAIARHMANPCNKLPGKVLQNLYRNDVDTKELNRLALKWLNDRVEIKKRRRKWLA
jgi:hypothetical protein